MLRQRTFLGIGLVLVGFALLVTSYWGESLVGVLMGVGAVLAMASGVVLLGTAGETGDGEAGEAGGGTGA